MWTVRIARVSSASARWACRQWSRNAFQDMVDLLISASHHQKKETGLPGFFGAERPSITDIHILCHVFKHIPWSSSVEIQLRHRNFGLTTDQVTLILHNLKDNLSHTLNFFIWSAQQRGHCHNAACFEILKKTLNEHLDHIHPLLKAMETSACFIPLDVLLLFMEVFVEKNMVDHAFEVFQNITKFGSRPDEDAYNIMLQILTDAGRDEVAFEVFKQMKKDKWCRPDVTTYCLVLFGFGKAGRIPEAYMLLKDLKSSNMLSEAHGRFVCGLCEGGRMIQAEEAVLRMYELKLEPDVHVFTSLIAGHAKVGKMTEAYRYYVEAVKDELLNPNRDILSLLIVGFCEQNDVETAHNLLQEMTSTGLSLDVCVYRTILQSASKQGHWQVVQMLLDELVENEISVDQATYSRVLAACADAAELDIALSLLCQMLIEGALCPDQCSFDTLLSRLIELDQPEYWQRLFLIMEGLEESLQTLMRRMVVKSLSNVNQGVAEKVLNLMAQRGLGG